MVEAQKNNLKINQFRVFIFLSNRQQILIEKLTHMVEKKESATKQKMLEHASRKSPEKNIFVKKKVTKIICNLFLDKNNL